MRYSNLMKNYYNICIETNTVNRGVNFLRVFAAKLWILLLNLLNLFKIDPLGETHNKNFATFPQE